MMPLSNIPCLICQANIEASSCVNIFSTPFPGHGELLVNFVSKVLRVGTSELQDSYICLQCYNLFQMLEQAQKTVFNIRCEILKIYRASERKKNLKKTMINDTKTNLSNITLEEGKLNGTNEKLGDEINLDITRIDEGLPQQCVQHNMLNQDISIPSIECAINNAIVMDEKNHGNKKINICNDIDNLKSFDYNNIHKDTKNGMALENNVIHTSIPLAKDNNIYNVNTSQEQNFVSLVDAEKCEPKSSKVDDIFSANKIEVPNIDLKWKEFDENIIHIKENNENTGAATVDQMKTSVNPKKILKHDLKPLKYSCPTCEKRCKTAAELKTHIKTHSTLRPYMCEKCGQAYKHKHALEIHVGMHNGINPFQCNFCQKCFTQKGALMRHLPLHTGEMPYQCELCGKRFIHHTSYNMHRLSHSGKKSYKCHMCDLSLLSTSHLKRHMRVHTGEKPYSCTVCGKRFAERYNLLAHQKIHDTLENKSKKDKKMQYQCNHCNLVFEHKQNLNEHMKQHKNTPNQMDEKKSQCMILQLESEACQLQQKIESDHNVLQETWIQMNNTKLDIIDNQGRFVILENSLPEIDENSFAVAFNHQKLSLESTNYDTSLQVIIEPSDSPVLSNELPTLDKMHM